MSQLSQAMGLARMTFCSPDSGLEKSCGLALRARAASGRGRCPGRLLFPVHRGAGPRSGPAQREQLGPAVFSELRTASGISK